jgi:hypothetical protein
MAVARRPQQDEFMHLAGPTAVESGPSDRENSAPMETTYAYLAGAIDSRGTITFGVSGRSFFPRIALSGTSPDLPNLALAILSGTIYHRQPRKPSFNAFYHWEVRGHAAREPLLRLRPYLRSKRRHAEIALEMLDLIDSQFRPISAEDFAKRVRLFEQMDRLNPDRRRQKQPITGY